MKRNILGAAIITMTLALGGFAQTQQEGKTVRKLGSVTWNPVEHTLSWTVSKGTLNGQGKFVENDSETFQIDMDSALMSAKGEDRRFSEQEAVSVHALMDLVAKYAAESTVWWDSGKGDPISGDEKAKLKRGEKLERPRVDEIPRHDDSQTRARKVVKI